MPRFVRSLAAAASLAVLSPTAALAPAPALAQSQPAAEANQQVKQIALTDAQIEGYLAAQPEIEAILAKAPPNAAENPDPKVMAQLDAAVKKHKFASYEEFDDIGANIGLVMDGVDPQTQKYVGAEALLKKQIAEVEADAKMPAQNKKEALAEMNEELKAIEPVKFPANVDLVLKYYDKIAAASETAPAK